jgi:hypothetical protein
VSETCGRQEGSAYNGHFRCTCYHPLLCFNQFGDLERAMLREGNRPQRGRPALGARAGGGSLPRGEAAPLFPGRRRLRQPGGLPLPGAGGIPLRHPPARQSRAAARDRAPADAPGGPSAEEAGRLVRELLVSGGELDRGRRVVAKVEWHGGELFPSVGFIVTNLRRDAERVVKFYNGRGVAEQWIKEGKNAVQCTKLSCHDFVDNQVRLQLFALA